MPKQKIDSRVPRYGQLIQPMFLALKSLGGSGTNEEILNRIILDLKLPDDVADIPHLGSTNVSEVAYQAAWARTYLRKAGVIERSAKAVWFITPEYAAADKIDEQLVLRQVRESQKQDQPADDNPANDEIEYPDEDKPWKEKLSEVLCSMDPYGFERLAQRVLRDCGFSNVEVTKKSGDGGIDGTGKLRINGIFSFNVAFQCKRYSGQVGAPEIRDFRGSLTTDIEKGVFITTGSFTKAAKEEATNPGKQQIDLIDGDEFMNKIAEYQIGVHPVTVYEVDEEFFKNI